LKREGGVPHVVIVGAGFAGLFAAKALGGKPVKVTVLDRTNHHTFQPLLYQVATAGLNPADIAIPIRKILRRFENVTVLLGEVMRIDRAARRLFLEDGDPIDYDYLVLATGATHSYFGHDEFAKFAPGLKTVDEGLLIRQRIFLAYEEAEREHDEEKIRALLTFVVVGAGPTGVELAGALAEISRETLAHEFRNIDPEKARILLVEGGPRVLGTYPETLSQSAQESLERLGVEVRTGARVTHVDGAGVRVKVGDAEEAIASRTVVWAAGVAASPLARSLGVPLDPVGRVIVRDTLQIPGDERVYVVGDLAHFEQDGEPVPGMCPPAIQGGRRAVENILAQIAHQKPRPFRYVHRGSMATIGRASAVADLGRTTLTGYLAWVAWLVIHLLMLIGFKNRVLVLLQWAWSYFSYDRGSRLIHGLILPEAAESLVLPSKRGGATKPSSS
jgi:NADH dehydrogenase